MSFSDLPPEIEHYMATKYLTPSERVRLGRTSTRSHQLLKDTIDIDLMDLHQFEKILTAVFIVFNDDMFAENYYIKARRIWERFPDGRKLVIPYPVDVKVTLENAHHHMGNEPVYTTFIHHIPSGTTIGELAVFIYSITSDDNNWGEEVHRENQSDPFNGMFIASESTDKVILTVDWKNYLIL